MSLIIRSADVRAALRSRQRGFLLNPFRFGVALPAARFDSAATSGNYTLSNSDRTLTATGASFGTASTTVSRNSGKYYFEMLVVASAAPNANDMTIGVTTGTGANRFPSQIGDSANSWGYVAARGRYYHSSTNDGHSTCANGDVVMVAVDFTAGALYFGKNGTWNDSSNPAAGTGAAYTSGVSGTVYPGASVFNIGSLTFRGDAASQSYSPPSGFSAWV